MGIAERKTELENAVFTNMLAAMVLRDAYFIRLNAWVTRPTPERARIARPDGHTDA